MTETLTEMARNLPLETVRAFDDNYGGLPGSPDALVRKTVGCLSGPSDTRILHRELADRAPGEELNRSRRRPRRAPFNGLSSGG